MIYNPSKEHTFRLSYTTAYSLPNFNESYLTYKPNPFVEFKGNKDVDPERIRSWELGYQGRFSERLKGSAELFYNELEDFITFLPSPDNPFVYSFYNSGKYKASGGEMELEFYLLKDLIFKANYSYQYLWNDKADLRVRYSPLSKGNAALTYLPAKGFNTSLWLNAVGETNWTSKASSEDWLPPNSQTTRTGTDPAVPSYTMVNIKVGYRFSRGTEASVSAFNLLNDIHREFIAGDDIGRKVVANLTMNF